jgi:hypothetical protein
MGPLRLAHPTELKSPEFTITFNSCRINRISVARHLRPSRWRTGAAGTENWPERRCLQMTVQIIESNGKPVFAVVPMREWEALLSKLENLQDIADAKAA